MPTPINNIGVLDGDVPGTAALLHDVTVDLEFIASKATTIHRAIAELSNQGQTAWQYLLPDCMRPLDSPAVTDHHRADFIGMTIAIDYRHWTSDDFDVQNSLPDDQARALAYQPLRCQQFWYLAPRTGEWHRGSMAMTMALRDAVDVGGWHWYRTATIAERDFESRLGQALSFKVQPWGSPPFRSEDAGATQTEQWPAAQIPSLLERAVILKDIAAALSSRGESFFSIAEKSNGRLFNNGDGFIERICELSGRYADFAVLDGHRIALIKLAGLTAVALSSSRNVFQNPSVFCFTDMNDLSVCPDYQLPKTLRTANVIQYSARLAALVDGSALIPKDSREEFEIRVATTVAARALLASMPQGTSIEALDYCLWLVGRTSRSTHHLTITNMY